MPCVYEPLFIAMGAMTIECIQVLGSLSEQNGSQTSTSGRQWMILITSTHTLCSILTI